jgi:HSP20 family protein
MLLEKRNRAGHPLADFDPFSALSLLDGMWPTMREETNNTFLPAMDVGENEKEYLVRVEIPGMEKEDISIEFENNILTLTGEKKEETEKKEERFYRVERRYGAFTRSLRFKDVDTDHIGASYENGVLTVTVPKTVKAPPKKIEIA